MTIGLEEREKWLEQVGIDAKDFLLKHYSRKFITAIDVLNEAVFRKDAESIAKALAGAKSYYALLKELDKTQTNLRFFFDVRIDALCQF